MMTYAELQQQLSNLTQEQLKQDVTIEVVGLEEIFYPLEVRICDTEHDFFEEDEVVIFVE